MKKRELSGEIAKLSLDELKARGLALSEELMKLRFRQASGRAEKSHHLGDTRRNLARVLTQVNSKKKAAAK